MKLYTEEQVREVIRLSLVDAEESVIWSKQWYPQKLADRILQLIHPISLPTDEEIEKEINSDVSIENDESFRDGAKWMRDKIQGGNQ